jgi:CubicO group peptidase (beta-lactamase class C family)
MASATLSKQGLERLHRVLSGHVERGEMPGLAALVSRHGEIHVDVVGALAFGDAAPMQRDTIFRVASITKPITAVAGLMLMEDCRFRLDDPVDTWLPELAQRRVLTSIDTTLDDTVPARRAITIRDLFTYRMGFGSVMAPPGTYPIQGAIRDLRLGGDGPPRPALAPTPDEWIRGLGSLPLMAQPGERWMYNMSADALGVLIERVSGKRLGAFMRERIFEPLGMKDTAFYVPDEKLVRFPVSYTMNHETRTLDVFDGVEESAWRREPPLDSGAGGLVSTLDDYCAFCRLLLDKGRAGREQLLSRASVELMTSDQLSPGEREGAELFFGEHSSWGLGVAVDIARREIYHSPGRFGWTGGTGTTAYTDPANGAITILFTQRSMDSPEPPRVFSDFFQAVYGAME